MQQLLKPSRVRAHLIHRPAHSLMPFHLLLCMRASVSSTSEGLRNHRLPTFHPRRSCSWSHTTCLDTGTHIRIKEASGSPSRLSACLARLLLGWQPITRVSIRKYWRVIACKQLCACARTSTSLCIENSTSLCIENHVPTSRSILSSSTQLS